MLAHAVEVDVFDDDHFAVVDREQRAVHDVVDVGVVATRQELQSLLDALRRVEQSFAARILAKLGQKLPNEVVHVSILSSVDGPWKLAAPVSLITTGCS